MAKQFKLLRISSFHCCRSNDISVVPTDPPSPLPPPKPHHSSLRRHVSSAFRTAACGCRSSSTNSDDDDDQISKSSPTDHPKHMPPTPLLDSYDDVFALPKRQRRRRKKKSKSTTLIQLRISTSSVESGLFSSESFDEIDELEETETLISSSRTISSITDDEDDSSSELFNPQLETIREKPYKIKLRTKKEKEKRRRSSNREQKQKRTIIKTSPSPEIESPARLSVFQRLIPCTVEGKIRESFAVVKKSADPFEDFKRSMMEMIMEKEMFDEKDLEQLLHCLLSLNDREHHGIIVDAFSEIWQSLFCN